MSYITTRDGTEIYYKDWGSGQPIVFHHGWPLSSDYWDAQMLYFVEKGYRVKPGMPWESRRAISCWWWWARA